MCDGSTEPCVLPATGATITPRHVRTVGLVLWLLGLGALAASYKGRARQ